jgi:hypothetical protein
MVIYIGLMCKQNRCNFTTVNIDTLRMYAKQEHAVLWKDDTATLYEKVNVQTYFCAGGLQRYLIVDAADSSEDALHAPHEVSDVVSERLTEWKLKKHAHEEQAQVMDA